MIWAKISCLCILLQNALTIDFDYYFSSPTRSHLHEIVCDPVHKLNCRIRCGTKSPMCISNKCYCVMVRLLLEPRYLPVPLLRPSPSWEERPALRHHIAHFCPNLDTARKCIRKCMSMGKPAFCGKDHVCYCGHRYGSNDVNKKQDAITTYAMFRDMYQKYFGTNNGTNYNDDNGEQGDKIDSGDGDGDGGNDDTGSSSTEIDATK